MGALQLPRIIGDFETRSRLDVTDVGQHRYAEDESTEPLCFAYRLKGTSKTKQWVPGMTAPQDLIDHVNAGYPIEAHGAGFERAIWKEKMLPIYGWPMPKYWIDTMATCAYRSIPLGLDDVGNVLDLDVKKDPEGRALIRALCQPQKQPKVPVPKYTKKGELTTASQKALQKYADWREWNEDFGLYQKLYDYNIRDTDAEVDLGDTIGDLPQAEYSTWVLDQKINNRGVYLDKEAVESALYIVTEIETALNAELPTLTEGKVEKGTQGERIKNWLESKGLFLPNLQKETVEVYLKPEAKARLESSHGKDVVRVLEIRQQLAMASTGKLSKMLEWVCRDGRIRGMLQYHGSGTGRWAGRGPQPQNFPRGNPAMLKNGIEALIAAIKCRSAALLEAIYGDPMMAIATSLRGMFISAPGKILNVGDFSAIESRVVDWLADQEQMLEAYRKYDRGEGPDIYCVMAADIYGRVINKKDDPEERQLGKITKLGCGYQMSGRRLMEQAWDDYKVRITEERGDELVAKYRASHDRVKNMWYAIEEAAVDCIRLKQRTSFRNIQFEPVTDAAGDWFTIILPNGRRLWYFNPQVQQVSITYKDGKTRLKWQLGYEGRNNKMGGVWSFVKTYGGMLVENIVQAISRDLMVEAMFRAEKAGYPLILTVHDELIAETDISYGDRHEFECIMAGPVPLWADGLPVAVEAWRGTRYKKG